MRRDPEEALSRHGLHKQQIFAGLFYGSHPEVLRADGPRNKIKSETQGREDKWTSFDLIASKGRWLESSCSPQIAGTCNNSFSHDRFADTPISSMGRHYGQRQSDCRRFVLRKIRVLRRRKPNVRSLWMLWFYHLPVSAVRYSNMYPWLAQWGQRIHNQATGGATAPKFVK